MGKEIAINANDLVLPWVATFFPISPSPAAQTIAMVEDGIPLGVVLYDDFNGANINMHVAGITGRWLSKTFLWMAFDYPFNQLGCRRVTGLVPSSNADARRFDEHLGFRLEATLKDAHPDGDLLVYAMHREDCRWLNLKVPGVIGNGRQSKSTESA